MSNTQIPVIPGMRILTRKELKARILTPSQLEEKVRESRREGLRIGKKRWKILGARAEAAQ